MIEVVTQFPSAEVVNLVEWDSWLCISVKTHLNFILEIRELCSWISGQSKGDTFVFLLEKEKKKTGSWIVVFFLFGERFEQET